MPNLTLEYTRNLPAFAPLAALQECNQTLDESGQFAEIDIKSRAVAVDTFVIGTVPDNRAFVHATLALLSGRPPEVKRDLSHRLLSVLQRHIPATPGLHIQIVVELQDMERDSFSKLHVVP